MAANTPGMLFQFVLNPDGSFYFPFVGEGCREFYGVAPQTLYDRPTWCSTCWTRTSATSFLASLHESARTLTRWQTDSPFRAPDGSRRWLEGIRSPRRSAAARSSGTG